MTELKGEIDYCTLIVRDFNIPLSVINKTSRQSINKEVVDMNKTIY